MTDNLTIEKAMNRLFWRFGNGQFKPNQADIDSLKFMAEWINREKEKELQQNTIFAKLYVYNFIREIEFYKDIKFAQKNIHEILLKPLKDIYNSFHKYLNGYENNKYLKSIGIKDIHPVLMKDEEIDREKLIIEDNQEEVIKYLFGIWDKEKVDQSLNNQISEAINRYKNLP